MSSIIQVSNLSKSFIISHEGTTSYKALRDEIAQKAKSIFSFGRSDSKAGAATREEFWALKNVSFSIEQGDRIGIIGRNGAGKSTLLKILSRISEPTSGSIRIKGRVASLLEVGTGFHPELTGRENIFLNGAILGMNREEIRKKFDEIVDFAEIEKFLDTPVKRYSSGMYVRLAFAVAAHLEPEILVIDEVLAVGDAQFQKKCLGKMEDVSKNEGRTVLFVSHQMNAIETLTNKAIYLKGGMVDCMGETESIVNHYLHDYDQVLDIRNYKTRSGNGLAMIVKVEVQNKYIKKNSLKQGESFSVLVGIECTPGLSMDISFFLENFREQAIFCTQFSDKNNAITSQAYVEVEIPIHLNILRKGEYLFSMAVYRPDKSEFYDTVLHFPLINIEGMDEVNEFPQDNRWGDLYFPIQWKLINQ